MGGSISNVQLIKRKPNASCSDITLSFSSTSGAGFGGGKSFQSLKSAQQFSISIFKLSLTMYLPLTPPPPPPVLKQTDGRYSRGGHYTCEWGGFIRLYMGTHRTLLHIRPGFQNWGLKMIRGECLFEAGRLHFLHFQPHILRKFIFHQQNKEWKNAVRYRAI